MSLYESRESTGEVSLQAIFDNPSAAEGTSNLDIEDFAYIICRGGWPEAVTSPYTEDALTIARDYINVVAREDISRVDGVERNPDYALLLMAAYARCVSTQASLSTIRGSIKAQKNELARSTVDAYIAALRKLYVFEDLLAWRPSLRDRTRITSTPKRHFVDPSLAVAALGATPEIVLKDMPTLGVLFESLCIRDLRIYAESLGGSVFHYHDDAGREADAVVVLPDSRWALVEIKMRGSYIEEGANNLIQLKDRIDKTVMGPPSFLMVLAPVTYTYQRQDGVVVASPACLRP